MINDAILAKALSYASVREVPGSNDNPEILGFFETAGHGWVNSDETPWCSAFACHVVRECGGVIPESRRLRARSWLTLNSERDHATRIDSIDELEPGDVVVLWRNGRDSIYGHVGFFCDATTNWIYLLGGNQSNRVCVKAYPAYRFLEGRRVGDE